MSAPPLPHIKSGGAYGAEGEVVVRGRLVPGQPTHQPLALGDELIQRGVHNLCGGWS